MLIDVNAAEVAATPAVTSGTSAVTSAATVFLELLDREAPVIDFERPLREALAGGAGGDVLAGLETAKLLALRVRGELAERRRREAELAALFETASDLAALHDVDSVLRAIVRRTRLLLGTDVAYLTLHDTVAGDTYMRVTSGSVSAYFQRVHLGMGEGLGGLVAERATPYATADYFADERIRHVPTIDRAVREEGLISILGAPLLLGTAVIGVLFAADRRNRQFGARDVSLLCSMAAHAAIAIDAAKLLEQTRAALTELNAANRLIKEHSAAVERAAQAHQRFTELVLSGGQGQDIARAVAAVLGGDVVILGEQDTPVASSGAVLGDMALGRAAAQARSAGRAVRCDGHWAVSATAGAEQLGTLVLRAGPDLPEEDRLILERAATVTALLLLVRRSVAQAEHRVRGELLSDLLSAPHRDAESFRARALRLGADLDKPHVVIVAHTEAALRSKVRPAAAHLAATRHGLAADHERHAVLLLPGTDPEAAAREVATALGLASGRPAPAHGATIGATIGAAGPTACPEDIAGAYSQAHRCVQALLALGRRGAAATATELGFLGMLLSDRKDVPGFIRSAIGRLLDYDERKGTELVRTVDAYFRCGGNLSKTKDALHVHVNTVTQRLERVTVLLGDDWQLGERALEIRVAVHLHKLGADGWAA